MTGVERGAAGPEPWAGAFGGSHDAAGVTGTPAARGTEVSVGDGGDQGPPASSPAGWPFGGKDRAAIVRHVHCAHDAQDDGHPRHAIELVDQVVMRPDLLAVESNDAIAGPQTGQGRGRTGQHIAHPGAVPRGGRCRHRAGIARPCQRGCRLGAERERAHDGDRRRLETNSG